MESASVKRSGTAAVTQDREGLGEHKRVIASLAYDQAYPLQLEITVIENGTPTTWAVARDLIQAGCYLTSGMGDVVVSTRGNAVGITFISVDNHEGTLWIRKGVVQKFLDDTYLIVPAGRESEHMNWDAAIEVLLNAE